MTKKFAVQDRCCATYRALVAEQCPECMFTSNHEKEHEVILCQVHEIYKNRVIMAKGGWPDEH